MNDDNLSLAVKLSHKIKNGNYMRKANRMSLHRCCRRFIKRRKKKEKLFAVHIQRHTHIYYSTAHTALKR